MRTPTTTDIRAELIRRASEVTRVAEKTHNLNSTQGRMLKEAARSIAAGTTEIVRRMDPVFGAFAIMEERIRSAERGAPKRAGLALHCREEQRDSASRRD